MNEYSVSYDFLTKKGEVTSSQRGTACYGGVFHSQPPGELFYAYFGIDSSHGDDVKEVSEWWINEFVTPRIPKRMHGSYTVEPLDEKGKTPRWTPWVTVQVDLTKIYPIDLYLLLVAYRYPQENFRLIWHMKNAMDKDKTRSLDEVFVQSHEHLSSGYGHALLDGRIQYSVHRKFPKYHFGEAWEKIPPKISGRTTLCIQNMARSMSTTAYITPEVDE